MSTPEDFSDPEFIETPTKDDSNDNPTQEYYVAKNQKLKILVTLVRGMTKPNGDPLIDLALPPWKGIRSASIKASNQDYANEVLRRYNLFAQSAVKVQPRPKAWRADKLFDWLDNNPITAPLDVDFLQREVDFHFTSHTDRQKEEQQLAHLTPKHWRDDVPYLRLIHALVDIDQNKNAFLRRHEISSNRLVVDNRRSEGKSATTAWELIADIWNSVEFQPMTEEAPEVHSDFTLSKEISFYDISEYDDVTPEKVESKFSSMIVVMNRGIAESAKVRFVIFPMDGGA